MTATVFPNLSGHGQMAARGGRGVCGMRGGREDVALLTFCGRHVGWQRGSSRVEDDKNKAVKRK